MHAHAEDYTVVKTACSSKLLLQVEFPLILIHYLHLKKDEAVTFLIKISHKRRGKHISLQEDTRSKGPNECKHTYQNTSRCYKQ
jgi:hypothetical protein